MQHTIMYAAFVIVGIADILTSKKYRLPPKTDYMVLLLAVLVEAFQFSFHLHGRTPVDTMVHKLLIYSAIAEAVFIGLEMRDTHCVLYALGRAFWTALHGAWLAHIAFMLYHSPTRLTAWNLSEDDQMTVVGVMFGWFMILFLAYTAFIGWLVCRYASSHGLKGIADEERQKLITNGQRSPGGDETEVDLGSMALSQRDRVCEP
ncbi:transmembrane protein 45B-like [Ornithodoros turicata]|uniref:transmembrane protein 45B-like n=1 Tax=Ornithodoros turicata TaxID=34597 RepID=UPI00313922A1